MRTIGNHQSNTKRAKFHLLFIILFFQFYAPPASPIDADITFITNCGFMLASGETTVIMDGFVTPDGFGWFTSEAEIENERKLENCEFPFDNIDLILTTHEHGDHCNVRGIISHLHRNSGATLIAPPVIVNWIKTYPAYQYIKDQVIAVYPKPNEYDSLHVKGMDLLVYNIPHSGDSKREMQHNAYLFTPTTIASQANRAIHSNDMLVQNYPNPFNPATTICFIYNSRSRLRLRFTILPVRKL